MSGAGEWLRQQAARRGALGAVAEVATVMVNRTATLVSEASAELARATSAKAPPNPGPRPARRHRGGAKHRSQEGDAKRRKA
ncbi:MAG: hypothetical protein ACREN1_02210 [Candidatus Dormibacteria bacterium]